MPLPVAVTTRLWLLGQGIEHSPSPAMQNAALRALGLDWDYSIRDIPAADLRAVVEELRDGRAAGCNVTIPHKRGIAQLCDSLADDAAATGAVNTVVRRDDGALVGHNTDARGFELALRHEDLWPVAGSHAVVLGNGGAASALALALTRAGVSVTIAARSSISSVSENSSASNNSSVSNVSFVLWDHAAVLEAISRPGPALLVNATPAPLPALPVDVAQMPRDTTIVDLRYRYAPDDLVPTARARGLRSTDGLEMLLQQGMLSFQLWTGMDPPIDVARKALHQAVRAA